MKKNDLEINNEYVLWTRDEVKQFLGFKSDSALYGAIKNHKFPKPLRIGGQLSRWRKSEVLKYIDDCEQKLAHEV